MEAIVESIDPARDLLLFPDHSSVPIALALRGDGDGNKGEEEGGVRYRLILLEGNWTYATKMASYLKGRVTGLRSVCLGEEGGGHVLALPVRGRVRPLYHRGSLPRLQTGTASAEGRGGAGTP